MRAAAGQSVPSGGYAVLAQKRTDRVKISKMIGDHFLHINKDAIAFFKRSHKGGKVNRVENTFGEEVICFRKVLPGANVV